MNKKYKEIPVELIDENPDNEQIFGYEDVDYLAESIQENGFGGAIEVYELANGRYEISSGHRPVSYTHLIQFYFFSSNYVTII